MHVYFCWSVVMYTPHIAWLWNINVCHIFYNIFSIIFIKSAMLHPLNKPSKLRYLDMTSSVNHQSASVFGYKKKIGMRLPTNWLLDHNSIACFPTKSPSQPFFSWCCLWHFWHNQVLIVYACLWTAIEWKCNAIVNQLPSVDGKRHTIVFQIR